MTDAQTLVEGNITLKAPLSAESGVELDGDGFLARVEALLPALRKRRSAAAELRRIPEDTIRDFQAAQLFNLLQPGSFGGFEVHPNVFFRAQMRIASVCPSTAWVFGVVGVHSWQLSLFDAQAQNDVWGEDPSTLISSSYAPTGKVEAVPGGYKVSGRWSFSSGCDHCKWVFLGGFAPTVPGAKGPDMRTFLLPRADYRIEDNWHVMGLRGTGSKDIVVDGAFVPEHRTHKMIDGFFRKSPGNQVNAAPLYRIPFGLIFTRSVSTSAIGGAEGALQAFASVAKGRIAASDQSKVSVDPVVQRICAEADGSIEEIKSTLFHQFDVLMDQAKAAAEMPLKQRVRYRLASSQAAERCVALVNTLFNASGGRAIFEDSPILPYWLDLNAARAHYANSAEKPARNLGGLVLGQKNADFFL